jgi:hypothetical protein
VLGCAQHWEDLGGCYGAIEHPRLNVSKIVSVFISSRDGCNPEFVQPV